MEAETTKWTAQDVIDALRLLQVARSNAVTFAEDTRRLLALAPATDPSALVGRSLAAIKEASDG